MSEQREPTVRPDTQVGAAAWPSDVAAAGHVASGLLQALDELAHGLMVVGPDGRIEHANQAARQELARRRVLGVRRGRLAALSAPDACELAAALAAALGGKRRLVSLGGPGAPQLCVAVLPLRRGGDRADVGGAVLLLGRASVCDALMLCFFARRHGLTAAEEQVLAILCQGDTAPEAARQLQVAVSTVRSHIRSLCAKTGAGSVRELVGRVAMLPPVAPALPHTPVH